MQSRDRRRQYISSSMRTAKLVHPRATVLGRQRVVRSNDVSLSQPSVRQVVSRRKKGRARTNQRRQGKNLRSKVGSTLTPPKRTVWLEYVSEYAIGVGGSHATYAYPLYTNGAYAVDPSAPSGFTTTPGFSVPATQYAAYRVLKYKGKVTFSNTFAAVGDSIVCHSNTALGASNGGSVVANILQFSANRPTVNTIKPFAVSGAGASQVTHSFNHTIPFIAGESIMQPGYKSATNTVPSILTYLVFGWELTAPATNYTMSVSVKLLMKVQFLDYIDTLTSFAISEEERLSKLGTPADIKPCAGCASYHMLENIPCPDPECSCVDRCTNCGFTRRCIEGAQSPKCPYRKDLAPISPPVLVKANSRTLVKGQ